MTTKYFDKLLAEISKTGKPSPEDSEYIRQFFKPIKSERNSILEEQDKIPEYLYFINSGFMRLFYYDQNGEEQTTFLCLDLFKKVDIEISYKSRTITF